MTTFRWIIFLPAFLIINVLTEALAKMCIIGLYDFAFPINDLTDYFIGGLGVFLMISIIISFASAMFWTTHICPNQKIGSLVCVFVYAASSSYYLLNIDKYSNQQLRLALIFFIVCELSLLLTAFRKKGSV